MLLDDRRQLLPQAPHGVGRVRGVELAAAPAFGTVQALHVQPGNRGEPAEFQDGAGVAPGDDRDLDATVRQGGQDLGGAGHRARVRRVGDDRGERAVEVQRHQRMPGVGAQGVDDLFGSRHRTIFATRPGDTREGVGGGR